MEDTPTNNRTTESTNASENLGRLLTNIGGGVLRYGIVGILLYYGFFKFTAEEAAAIEPLVKNSPLMAWLYQFLSVQGVSILIGVSEIVFAVLIATRPFLPFVSAIGSLGAVGMSLITLSFLFSTPGAWIQLESFPLPVTTETGGFLIKDIFLLGAAIYTAGEALMAYHAAQQRAA